MSAKKNVYLVQIPFQYNSDTTPVYFPYSVAMLWSYAQTCADIRHHYDLREIVFIKESITNIVNRMQDPAVVGLSCYMWNLNFTMELARCIRERWPRCVLVAGGPSVPVQDDDFLERYPWLDVLIYREGEIAFRDLLRAMINSADFHSINGVAFRHQGRLHRTAPARRVDNLDQVPSPYLTGLFDGMQQRAAELGITVNGIIETNRGCPFSCTFCDWGNGTLGKVKKFQLDRVKRELLWMARNRVEFITNCDANFGIYRERDMEICRFMTRLKQRYGFPGLFDTNWHKNNNISTVEMAQHLMDHGMLRRFTSSIQSQNRETLQAIKRRNLSDRNIEHIVEFARDRGIITLTELIIGLPNETYQSFQQAYVNLIHKGMVPTASPLVILPNSEMNDPDYRQQHGLVTTINHKHYTHVTEQEEVVIGTRTLSVSQYERLVLWCWFIQQFHFHGYTNVIYDFFHEFFGWDLVRFYDTLLDHVIEPRDCLPNRKIAPLRDHVSTGQSSMLTLGTVNYDLHDDIGHRNRPEFQQGLRNIVQHMLPNHHDLLSDIMTLQNYNQVNLDREEIEMFETHSNLWQRLYHGQDLQRVPQQYWVRQVSPDRTRHASFGEFIVNTRFTQQWRTTIEPYNPEP